MKKFLPLIMVLMCRVITLASISYTAQLDPNGVNSSSSIAGNSDYDPLVKEGKTFWYYQRNKYNPSTPTVMEFGMKIGSEIKVGNDKWNEVILIRKAQIGANGHVISLSDEPITIQYIRENDMKVQTTNCPLQMNYYPWNSLHWDVSLDNFFLQYVPTENIYDLYDFTPEAKEYNFGTDDFKYTMTLKSEDIREFEGISRRVKTYVKAKFEPEDMEPISSIGSGQEFELIEGIGVRMVNEPEDEQHYMSELFFAPFSYEQYISVPLPFGYFLRYVTDEDNNVVYEGRGGIKLWTIDPSGVEDVTADSSEKVEWYTLSGVRISAPGEHGVYIRKCGSNAEKVRF